MFILVPDEDLYEQGYWLSLFNHDHKATFTISKQKSWSPVSYNFLQLAESCKDAKIISLRLQDDKYNRKYFNLQKWTRLGGTKSGNISTADISQIPVLVKFL